MATIHIRRNDGSIICGVVFSATGPIRSVTVQQWHDLDYELPEDNDLAVACTMCEDLLTDEELANHPHGPQDHNPLLSSKENDMYPNTTTLKAINFLKTMGMPMLGILFLMFIAILIVSGLNSSQIIKHPNWDKGAFICENHNIESEWIPVLVSKEKGNLLVRSTHGGSYLVEESSFSDPELKELMNSVPDLCGYKANMRPWWQRIMGVAGHNHFVKKGETIVYAVQHPDWLNQGEVGISGTNGAGGFTISPEKVGRHLEECDGDFNLIWK